MSTPDALKMVVIGLFILAVACVVKLLDDRFGGWG